MKYIIEAAEKAGASDIHLVYGLPAKMRVHGRLVNVFEHSDVLNDLDLNRYISQLCDEDKLISRKEVDCSCTIGGVRLRVNIFKANGHDSVSIRLLHSGIPKFETLGLPKETMKLSELRRGIILVTGETGSGKSTTLAAMLEEINHTRDAHIITLEDPIEYIYEPDLCIINQREVGSDTASFAEGLRAALREDPNIILIGEMRDAETIETALTAAETGHLVFATLHTNSAADTIDRIVSVFPEGKQAQIRMALSMTLKAVISQQLLQKKGCQGRVLAYEIMYVTPAIQNLIREGKTPQINNAIATSVKTGSITMDNCLVSLAQNGYVSCEEAVAAAYDGDYVEKLIRGVKGPTLTRITY